MATRDDFLRWGKGADVNGLPVHPKPKPTASKLMVRMPHPHGDFNGLRVIQNGGITSLSAPPTWAHGKTVPRSMGLWATDPLKKQFPLIELQHGKTDHLISAHHEFGPATGFEMRALMCVDALNVSFTADSGLEACEVCGLFHSTFTAPCSVFLNRCDITLHRNVPGQKLEPVTCRARDDIGAFYFSWMLLLPKGVTFDEFYAAHFFDLASDWEAVYKRGDNDLEESSEEGEARFWAPPVPMASPPLWAGGVAADRILLDDLVSEPTPEAREAVESWFEKEFPGRKR